jgi:hypothetical protein
MRTVDFALPSALEPRLQRRYRQLVQEHLNVGSSTAPGSKVLPGAASAFASTQAAWRFYRNPKASLAALMEPLLAQARTAIAQDCQRYGLVVHDWSALAFNRHSSKKDRARLQNRKHRGYELQTALLLSDQEGQPLAPLVQNLRAQPGVYSTYWQGLRPRRPRLDELTERLDYLGQLALSRPLVHILDREGDSVGHYRQWQQQGRLFLVRANERRVQWAGQSLRLREVVAELERSGAFTWAREVEFKGRKAHQFVAETRVVLDRPARPKRQGKGGWVAGEPLSLRLVVSQVRALDGRLLATWLLLSNVDPTVSAQQLALWYYWRWRVESLFKLLKSAGHQVEHWQQETAPALARRLAVASMACVVVWQLARDPSPEAARSRHLLVQLSGRTMKRGQPWTAPALLAGLWTLLAMLDLLEHGEMDQLKHLIQCLAPVLEKGGGPLV